MLGSCFTGRGSQGGLPRRGYGSRGLAQLRRGTPWVPGDLHGEVAGQGLTPLVTTLTGLFQVGTLSGHGLLLVLPAVMRSMSLGFDVLYTFKSVKNLALLLGRTFLLKRHKSGFSLAGRLSDGGSFSLAGTFSDGGSFSPAGTSF